MIYGYARVSTDGQSVDAQLRQLRAAGVRQVFSEVASEAKTDRSQLRRALDRLDADDVPLVTMLGGPEFERQLLHTRIGQSSVRAKAYRQSFCCLHGLSRQRKETVARKVNGELARGLARTDNVRFVMISNHGSKIRPAQ